MAETITKTVPKKAATKTVTVSAKPADKKPAAIKAPAAAKPAVKKPATVAPATAKPEAKKPTATKPAVAKTATKNTSAAKPAAKGSSKTMVISDAQRYRMVAEAAYYRAESNQFKSDSVRDWIEAEADIAALLNGTK